MITDTAPQGTTEWMTARAGIPTASNFDKIITTSGTPSKQAQKYMFTLAAERITNIKEETYQNEAMKRGIIMEEEARAMYSLVTGYDVKQVGLCYPDDKKLWGASPDGLVGEDGCLEIKSPCSAIHISYLLGGELPSDYIQQTQGQLLTTGRKWLDFVSYYPGIKPFIVRVTPDAKFLRALTVELEIFCKNLDEITIKLKGM